MRLASKLLAVAVLVGAASAVHAAVIYQTGFEAPVFTPGAIAGQDGWTGGGTIQTGVVASGSQALQVAEGQFAAAPLGPISVGMSTLRIEFDLQRRSGSGGQAGVSVFGDSGFIGQFATAFDNPISAVGNTNSNTDFDLFTADLFHHIVFELRFGAQTMEAFVDGVTSDIIAINNAVFPSTVNTIGFTSAANGGTTIFVDNLTISQVPEPATLPLLGLGLLAFVRMRKRRA